MAASKYYDEYCDHRAKCASKSCQAKGLDVKPPVEEMAFADADVCKNYRPVAEGETVQEEGTVVTHFGVWTEAAAHGEPTRSHRETSW
jgi:hypothetical protein